MLNLCHISTIKQWFTTCNTKYNNWWLDIIHDWQTLLTALIAGVPTAIGAFLLWKQINIQMNENKRIRTQQEISSRIRMPHALFNLSSYWKHCYRAIVSADLSLKTEDLPIESLDIIMSASPSVDKTSFETIHKLVVLSQVFEAKLTEEKQNKTNKINQELIIDIGYLDYYTDNLYDFARFEAETIPPLTINREIISEQIIYQLDLNINACTTEKNLVQVESALNKHFKKKKNNGVDKL